MRDLIKEKGFEYLIYILLLSLFFSMAVPNIILVILSVYTIINCIKNRALVLNFTFSARTILLVLLGFLTVKSVFFGTIVYDFKIYKGFFLLFWLAIVLKKVTNLNSLKGVLLWGINAVIVCSVFLVGLFFLKHHSLPFSNTAEVNDLLLLERPYIGFIAVLGFLLAIEKVFLSIQYKYVWIINAALLFLFIILISARISIITLLLVTIIYLFFYVKISFLKKVIFLISFIVFFGFIVVTNKNISERFFIKSNLEESLKVASDYEPRIVIWNCAFSMTQKSDFNSFIGFDGYSTVSDNFLDCYSNTIENVSKKEYFLSEKFNSHNQFIDFYLIGGLIGLALFVAFFIKLFLEVRENFFQTAIVASFLLFFCVENIFYRQFGCYLVGIFILSLCYTKKEINE
ncbi:O-antigen ligase [Flavobacterium sp. B183]|uniref:O-antigen ligase family protein n=1 Tax=Flavobacterium sp. B183 TaxID=907046 RepID=UPI00201F5A6A|nr:O-antigen ligase family protein [Flavobacterium sp. B183]URC13699.1 O-antigen ligase family protein [Flavobacterium sp. B183]